MSPWVARGLDSTDSRSPIIEWSRASLRSLGLPHTIGGMNLKSQPATRGRKPNPDSKSGQIRTLLASGMSATDIAKKVGCTPALVYNVKAAAAGKKRGGGATAKRGPGRPRNSAASANMTGLAGILDAVKNGERERVQLRAALEKIQAVLADALA